MRTLLPLILLATTALAACTPGDSPAKAERRAALTEKVFPDAADRQGIVLTFPWEHPLEVAWIADQVSEDEIVRRVAGYCARTTPSQPQVAVFKDLGTKTETLSTSGTQMVRSVVYKCV